MKRFLFFLTIIILVSGCKDSNNIIIKGVFNVENPKEFIYLNKVEINMPILIDSAKINKKGAFRFKVASPETEFYQLGFSNENFITLLASPGDKIDLTFNNNNLFENYTIDGSEDSRKIQMLDNNLAQTKRKLDSLSSIYDKAATEADFETKAADLEEEFTKIIKAQRKKNIEFIITNISSLVSIKALYQKINLETYVLYDPKDLQYLKIVTDSLTHHYPNSKQVQALARDFKKEMNDMYFNQLEQITKDMPEAKLDPNLEDVTGKRIALSSLRGKYVLLSFWSYQSKDCLSENLQFKEYYKLYNKKGFEIYQINLDENADAWKAAVKYDELPWINTKEDNPQNPKNALLFNVKSLPANYLFDKKGEIIASNLHGRNLRIKLEQLFNN